jgi:hypothetical protein
VSPLPRVRVAAVVVAIVALAAPASGAPREERDLASLRATLEKHAKDPYEQRARTSALRAVGRLGGPAAAEVVCGVLADPFVHIRDHAVSALIDLLEGPQADATRVARRGPLIDRTSPEVRRGSRPRSASAAVPPPPLRRRRGAGGRPLGPPGDRARVERVGDAASATVLLPAAGARDGAAAGACCARSACSRRNPRSSPRSRRACAQELARAGAVDGPPPRPRPRSSRGWTRSSPTRPSSCGSRSPTRSCASPRPTRAPRPRRSSRASTRTPPGACGRPATKRASRCGTRPSSRCSSSGCAASTAGWSATSSARSRRSRARPSAATPTSGQRGGARRAPTSRSVRGPHRTGSAASAAPRARRRPPTPTTAAPPRSTACRCSPRNWPSSSTTLARCATRARRAPRAPRPTPPAPSSRRSPPRSARAPSTTSSSTAISASTRRRPS